MITAWLLALLGYQLETEESQSHVVGVVRLDADLAHRAEDLGDVFVESAVFMMRG
jgi:hypothetical protein